MKRKFMSALLIVAATCFTVSCEKDDKDNQSNTNSKFSGTIEQLASDAKTVLGAHDIVKWCPGDTVTINGQRLIATLETPGTTTGFAFVGGEGTLDEPPYYAYYPASIYNGGHPTLPAVQKYTAGHIDNLPMYAKSESSTTLQFHNICGVMELNLKGTKTVKSISVTAMDVNTALNGRFTVVDNKADISYSQPSQRTVTLDCGSTGVALNNSTPIKFWIALPAFENVQLLLTVRATDGTCLQKKTLSAVTMEANRIKEINMTLDDANFKKMSGFFLVGDSIIQFPCGNLKKVGDTYTFFENQIGVDSYVNSTIENQRVNVDLFAYNALSAMDFKPPITNFPSISDDNNWKVPSLEDWESVISDTRPGSTVNGIAGCRFARVWIDNVLYLLLCPDNAVITNAATILYWNTTGPYNNNEFTTLDGQWQVYEDAGCVFLPAAGYSSGGDASSIGVYGCYLSRTPSYSSYINRVVFQKTEVKIYSNGSKNYYYPVRLAQKF